MTNQTLPIPTEGELKMLKMIAESEFRDSDDLTQAVWSPAERPEEKGWLSSCVQKNFACVDNQVKGYETAWLTELGIEILNQSKQK